MVQKLFVFLMFLETFENISAIICYYVKISLSYVIFLHYSQYDEIFYDFWTVRFGIVRLLDQFSGFVKWKDIILNNPKNIKFCKIKVDTASVVISSVVTFSSQ